MKTNKLLYAALAFAPMILVLILFVLIGMMFSQLAYDVSGEVYYKNEFEVPYFLPMMVIGGLTGIVSLIGLVMFAIHSQRNTHITGDKRTMWLVILIFLGGIGRIIYYFTWIAKEDQLNAQKAL